MSDFKIFCADQLTNIIDLDSELAVEIIDIFLETLPNNLIEIKKFTSEANFSQIKFSAHSLKNAAGNVGAEKLRFICQEIEQATLSEDIDLCVKLIGVIESDNEILIDQIKQFKLLL